MKILTPIALSLGLLLLAGCGGGGASAGPGGVSGGGSGGSGGNPVPFASVALYATDAVDAKYDHVWLTIREIDAIGDQGPVVLFKSSAGKTLDVRALNQGGVQRFAGLGIATPNEGVYQRVRVVLDKALSMVPVGKTLAVARTFSSDDGAGHAELEFDLPSGHRFEGKGSLVVDFDLSQWDDDGVHIKGVAKHHDDRGLEDPTRHEKEDFRGVIAGLDGLAPNQTFDLTSDSADVQIKTDASTVVFSDQSDVSKVLANGGHVEVEGKLDAQSQTVLATSIKVEDKNGEEERGAEAKGSVLTFSQAGMTLSLERAHHFTPMGKDLSVLFVAGTRFLGAGGAELSLGDFLKQTKTGNEVEAAGTYDAATMTFAAKSVKVGKAER